MQQTPPSTASFAHWEPLDRDNGRGYEDPTNGYRVVATEASPGAGSLVRFQQPVSVDGYQTNIDIDTRVIDAPPEPATRLVLDELAEPPQLVGLTTVERDDQDVIDFLVCDARPLDDDTVDELAAVLSESSPAHGEASSTTFDTVDGSTIDQTISIDVHPRLKSDVISHDPQ